MTTVRKLDLTIEPDTYPAIERTLIDSVAAGDAPPTVMQWTFDDDLFLELGPVEDASLIDRDRADEEGIAYGRRFNVSGGTGFFEGSNTPVLYIFFRDRGDHTMTEYIDLAGEAMARSLRDAGVSDAVYREGGDIELEPDEEGGQYAKVGVSGAGYQNGVWGVFMNLINETFAPETFGRIDEVLKLPEEKFEDKETDSAAGRMTSLSEVAPETDVDTIMAEGAANLANLVDGTVEPGELSATERDALAEHREYYSSTEWFEQYSTSRVFDGADADDRVAEVAYKGRKLIKVSVLVDTDDTIVDVEFTGDMYHKPAFEAVEWLSEAVIGESIVDDDALLSAIQGVYAAPDFEMPWLPPEDFLRPLIRARENLGPVSEFGRE
jgi:lipoate-protein ligase A